MGSPVLLLRLEGPLQSWGTRSRWDVRDTQPEPTKSGIVGLLGCALGYPVGDLRLMKLSNELVFGVRVEAPGRVLEDYQTITDYLPTAAGEYKVTNLRTGKVEAKAGPLSRLQNAPDIGPSTILSPRFYLEDAAFLVALEATPGARYGLLDECTHAIQHPAWPLFLGRKACIPTRPIYEEPKAEYTDIEDALRRHPWSWLAGNGGVDRRLKERDPGGKGNVILEAFIDDSNGRLTRQDVVQTNAIRQYGFRQVRRLGDSGDAPIHLSDVLPKEVSNA